MQLAGNDLGLAVAVGAAVVQRLIEDDENAQALTCIARVDQDRALLHQLAVALEGEIDRGVEHRVAGADEGGNRRPGDVRLVEADALAAGEHGRAGADLAVALAERPGDPAHLEAAGLAPVHAPAQVLEGGAKEALDAVGLEALGVRPLHLLADLLDPAERQGLPGQGTAVRTLDHVRLPGRVVDGLQQARLDLRPLAVADRVDEQFLQRPLHTTLSGKVAGLQYRLLTSCSDAMTAMGSFKEFGGQRGAGAEPGVPLPL